jgi:NAD+ synthetase
MRIALCQIDPTVGDLTGNAKRITECAERAAAEGARLAVFPELALLGYPPRDLLDRPGFLQRSREALDRLAASLPADLCCLVGFAEHVATDGRESVFNSVAVLRGGRIETIVRKQLLPTYDVFDERRYFTPGKASAPIEVAGLRIGITICEDIWNDSGDLAVPRYDTNPVRTCIQAGADVIVNVAASPFTLTKLAGRRDLLRDVARRHSRPVVFVNQVGGNDELVFDGQSMVIGPDGSTWARAATFAEDFLVADLAPGGTCRPQPESEEQAALEALVLGTRGYLHKTGFSSAVVGLSGGIDSALVAVIAAHALGPENVLGIALPTRYSSEGSLLDAEALARALGIDFRVVPIDTIFSTYLAELEPHLAALGPAGTKDVTPENLQARIRGTTLMAISNRLGHLLLTTGNKSEIAVGYCTLYGDMAGGLAVISDLPKTFVYRVAHEVNRLAGREVIPNSTLTKAPSAELRPNQTDQDSLPPYDVLDAILERYVEDHREVEDIVREGFDADVVREVVALVRRTEYKRRQMAPGLIVTRKAFGPGRRYPVAQRYSG